MAKRLRRWTKNGKRIPTLLINYMKGKSAEITVFVFSGFFVLFGIMMILNSRIKLEDLNKFTGVVLDKGITIKHSTSRYGWDSKVFYLQLGGLDEKLAIYKWNRNYTELMNSIETYDTLTVYFSAGQSKDKINIDLYQIETGNKLIYGLNDSTPRYRYSGLFVMLISLPLIGFGLFLRRLRIYGVINLKKKRKKTTRP